MRGWHIRVRGLVQGVGFRPHVWRLATQSGLAGTVLNDAEGVVIELFADAAAQARFLAALRAGVPPLARIDSIEVTEIYALAPKDFTISRSRAGHANTGISPDAATCPDCLADVFDPQNRRHLYPFTNCTHCGPRLTITRKIPYDRANTAMAEFSLCAACRAEYEDPADRRYHAQPNACPDCGPKLELVDSAGKSVAGDALQKAASLIAAGNILAIKGLGGFQLAVDAGNHAAIARLRKRKHRPAKPLALMVRDMAMAENLVQLTGIGRALLQGWQAPIVLLPDKGKLAPSIAPGQACLGLMLPNTPLHHILLQSLASPIVLTSGNLAGAPQIIDNEEALQKLGQIADYFLLHDRDIANRMDDSVVQMVGAAPQILRRGRGYAPAPMLLHKGFNGLPPTLAMGGDMKNTFCLLGQGRAIVSQHMGDMDKPDTQRDFHANMGLFRQIYEFTPKRVAVDAHTGYFSTRMGESLAAKAGLGLVRVQHHHAHIAAVMAENGLHPDAKPVLGIVLDGAGYGTDGTIWGGEFLRADYKSIERLAHFPAVALPGGDKASQQPWRNLFAHLRAAFGAGQSPGLVLGPLPVAAELEAKPLQMLGQMIEKGLNSPPASSAGRLFDAVAAILGLCFERIAFEGEAAMQVQALAEAAPDEAGYYPFYGSGLASWKPLWTGIIADLGEGVPKSIIAKRFHNTLNRLIVQTAIKVSGRASNTQVVLSGGVFQNRLLLAGVKDDLEALGFTVLQPKMFPLNDGGLSLGQAAIGALRP